MLKIIDRASINRANASKSTGPKTPEGKQRSAMNAYRHGFTGQVVILPAAEVEAHHAFIQSFHQSYAPSGAGEIQLVQLIADSSWQLNRCSAWIDQILAIKALQSTASFSPENSPEVNDALAIAEAAAQSEKDLNNFSIYQRRQHLMLTNAMDRLAAMQEIRRKKEERDLEEAAILLTLHEKEELERQDKVNGDVTKPPYVLKPFNPAASGFVFSTMEIKIHIDRQLRLKAGMYLPQSRLEAAA